MSQQIRWKWLDRYFSGECTVEEAREIEQWLDAAPERRSQAEALRAIWQRAGRQPDGSWNAQAAWQRLRPTLEVPAVDARPRPRLAMIPGAVHDAAPRKLHRRIIAYTLRAAAAVALIAGGTVVWRLLLAEQFSMSHAFADLHVYAAPRGQRASLLLADGTRIVLAPESRLRAPRDFARSSRRDVYLEGEAFFEVAHEASRPFVVHAAYGTAEDLGTQFVVKAYPEDATMRVVVAEGIVAVRSLAGANADAPAVLRPGALATVNGEGQIVTAQDVAVQEYLSWTTGQLVFRNATVQEVAAVLERWYDIDIHIAPPAIPAAAAQRVTLTTDPTQPLAEILTALTVPAGLQVEWINGAVVVDR